MGSFEELNIKIGVLDVAKAAGDLVMSALRHLPETGYPSDRQVSEPQPFVQQTFEYDDMGTYFVPEGREL